ncbi:MAG: helix-turn-helix transcriptional regulator [Chitinimonas sp.]|nr:helix-turn-helix transcriptional regulator [Chitinimonas sp.]
MLATDAELEQMALQQDVGWFMARGKRPRSPSRHAPSSLVALVHQHGLRLTEVALEMGVSDRTVQRWWSGVARPRPHQLVKLEEVSSAVRARQGCKRDWAKMQRVTTDQYQAAGDRSAPAARSSMINVSPS